MTVQGSTLVPLALLLVSACVSPQQARQSTLDAAASAASSGDLERAVDRLALGVRSDPRDIEMVRRLAEAELAAGRAHDAHAALVALPADVPRDDAYRAVLADAELRTGRLAEAAALVTALEAKGGAPRELVDRLLDELAARPLPRESARLLPVAWRERLVRAHIDGGALEPAALHVLDLPSSSTSRGLLLSDIVARAVADGDLEVVRRHRELLDGEPTPERLLLRHRLLVARDAWQEAESVEREMMARHPSHPLRFEVLLVMASRYNRTGRSAEALALADEAVGLSPSTASALRERAIALDALGRTDEARRAFELLLAADAADALAARRVLTADRRGDAGKVSIHIESERSP